MKFKIILTLLAFSIFLVFLLVSLLVYSNLLLSRFSGNLVFRETKSEVMIPDGKAFLYKVKVGDSSLYVATEKSLDGLDDSKIEKEKISENIFWSPANCAGMLTLSAGNKLYFFESKFKEDSASLFYDLFYEYDIEKNELKTFRNDRHVNMYSMLFEDGKILGFYELDHAFYKSEMKKGENNFYFENTSEIKSDEIKYSNWKGKIEKLDKENIKYFVIQ